jgi:hypothetical protein
MREGMEVRLLEIAALAAAAALAACEKAEDRAVLGSAPKQNLSYCAEGEVAATFRMSPGWCVASSNKSYVLDLASDGVLRVRAIRGGRPAETVWSSATKASGRNPSTMVFQADANLVVYEGDKAIWNIGAHELGAYRLTVTDDGDLKIRAADGQVVWAARFDANLCARSLQAPAQLTIGCLASPSGTYAMVLGPGGDALVAPVADGKTLGKPVWTSGTKGASPRSTVVAVQEDGNLVIYDGGKPIWNSETANHLGGAVRLELTDQGELQLHGQGGLLWSSTTGRARGI